MSKKPTRADIAALERQAKAAGERLATLTGGAEEKSALADFKAAERSWRAARRAAGEKLLPEEARGHPVSMGALEDLLFPLRDRIRKLEGKK